jgi:hypothetical protein
MQQINYHYLLMSQKDLLQNQGIEEILRERAHHYSIRKKSRDFWVLISPTFIYSQSIFDSIQKSNFYFQKESLVKSSFLPNGTVDFYSALVSTDKDFINWMQVRLGAFEDISTNQKNNLDKTIKFDGIRGYFQFNQNKDRKNPFESFSNYIHPDILLERNNKFLKLHYKELSKNIFKQI